MTKRIVRGGAALSAVAVAALLDPSPLTAQREDVTPLDSQQFVERRLDRGEAHRYALTLRAGDYVRVIVEQRGIDVTAQVRSADGTLVAEVQDDIRTTGEEQIEIVAVHAASYGVVVSAAPGIAAPGAYAIRVGDRRTATDADRAIQESRALRTTAGRLTDQGQFDSARAMLERALTLTEQTRGVDDVQTALVAAQLAVVYRYLPDNMKSQKLFARALSIMDRTIGPDHPTTAITRTRLATLYQLIGERAKGEALVQQSMDTLERTIGTDTRWFVQALTLAGSLRHDGGDFDQAEKITRRAMAILESLGDVESRQYAGLLNNLGDAYRARQDFARAEPLYQQSLAICTRVLGEDNYFIAPVLQNLGIVARERKDYATAEAYYARVLSIRERMVGPNHPDVAQVLNNIAIIEKTKGDIGRSLELHRRALSIWEHANGPYQDATLLSVGNIARAYASVGDLANALVYQRRADVILEKQLALNLAIGSERQKLLFVNGTAPRTDRTISLHLVEAPNNPDAAALAALVLLQRKGRVQDAMADTLAAIRQHAVDARDQALVEKLKTTTAELARLALNADPAHADQRRIAIKALEVRKEALEAELSERSAEFRAQARPVTLEAVQAAMPEDATLLEFAVFRPFDPKEDRNTDAYGPPHYAAYVVRKNITPRGFDLGPASVIDEAVAALRQALRDPRRADVKDRARVVDALVMRPLRGSFGELTRLIVSPDGDLNLVPFEALVDEYGRYLIERHAMSYVTSGRDLLRMQVERASRSNAAIFADPVFGEPPSAGLERSPGSVAAARRSVTTGSKLSAVYFAPLGATAAEARAIKTLFPEATLFTGQQARKAALQGVEAPRMLHIASHGFFLQDTGASVENPLLRSGIALAGANLTHESRDDGILTALEAAALDLWGTRLVTLSACDTGVGEVRNGEGVYGLRRAFVLAGTETLVMSLWPVSDAIAREGMVAYYTGLRAGLGRGDALRQSKLAMLKRPSRQHPYYWASFIQSGEWTPLDRPDPLRSN
jgi:CHAT domain-containing protein/Tfp pilus assembly protein PilF